ncbi:ABC transporter permease [Pedobacter alluvionis]|uniref:ABC-type lipoprotein release transport system permease subunit n=1 Tax=Pedobacter alluvionis TaxID=475253 RepID=A0A497YFF8_9SPHI|nr:ABC transporter permease [Pedobacter alluvionis]RLJ80129.1 ABC-type lipoprotein release transport system permease subunit [Pedobacter alluvionis]TFB31418.1 FtsX-like permease family protein [Pedobacter alluvionis]
MFRLNLKIALRNLWRNKGFTLINLGGLAIGLASCMVLLLYVAYEYGYDKQFTDYDKTYVVYNNSIANGKTFSWAWTPGKMADQVKEKIPGVVYAAQSSYPHPLLIEHDARKLRAKGVFVGADFLKILDYKFISGQPKQPLEGLNSVILTKTLAEKLFGGEDPINKVVKLDNNDLLNVEAVIEDVPANSSVKFDYLMSWALYEKREPWVKNSPFGNNICLTLVQLQNPDQLAEANAAIRYIYQRNDKDVTNEGFLHPFAKWHLYGEFANGKSIGGKIDQLKIFLMLAFCILLIACVNFMNLSTARSEKRAKEVGVRKAIGSSRKSLIGQFMLESVLLTLIGTILAFVLAEISLPYFNNLLGINLVIEYQNWKFWFGLLVLITFTGLLAGSYPAIYLSSFEPVKVIKGFSAKVGSSVSIRKILVVFQFIFAVCLIICTIVIYQQLSYIKNKPIGYDKGNLIQIAVQGNLKDPKKAALLKEELLKSGAAASVSTFSMDISEGGNNTSDITWQGKNPKEKSLFNFGAIGTDFTRTIGTELISGREFSAQFPNDTNSVLLNEAAVKMIGFKDPIGKIVKWGTSDNTVVGVVKDFVMESAYQKVAPMIFYAGIKDGLEVILVRLNTTKNISSSLSDIDNIVKRIEPNFPVDRKFVDESFEVKFQNEKLLGTLSNWFGGFAIFISCLGLLGLALFMAEQRKKEISIRKVLGASTANILTLLNKDFIKLVAIANLIAFPLAYIIINKWLSGYEYRISVSALPFIVAISLSVIIAILTVSVQSVKVAKANPIDALKYE